MVAGLMIDGIWTTNEATIKREAVNYSNKLFQNRNPCDPYSLLLNDIPKISRDMAHSLLQPVALQDVRDVFFSVSPYKAPGPDGFQPIFYQMFWDVIGKDISEYIAQVYVTGDVNPSLVTTCIVPIPKVDSPTQLKDFRPISLCNVLFKEIYKILVHMIRPFINDFIGPC